MREIKFRAWDKIREVITVDEDYVVKFDGSIGLINGNGDLMFNNEDGFLDDNYVLMQFTGLYDKNRKEIYEGDILATSNDGKDGCDIWDIKTFGYTKVIWDIASSRFRGTKWTWGVGEIDSVYDLNYVEVIGNIYESNMEKIKIDVFNKEKSGKNP